MEVERIGLDLHKQVFQLHGVDASGAEVFSKRLGRARLVAFFRAHAPVEVVMEACATAHYWGRELRALGHRVRLLPPRQVKAYIWGDKHDKADAAGLCAAACDPRIHPVPVKSEAQQAVLSLHGARERLVAQRTALGNAVRAHLAEFGITAAQGKAGLAQLLERAAADPALPAPARAALGVLVAQWRAADEGAKALEREIVAHARADAQARRLTTIPGVGPITASALAATIGDARAFRTGRHLAAWIGLTPRERSSGLKRRQGGVSKRGDAYLRRLLVLGAHARLLRCAPGRLGADPWLAALKARKKTPVAAVAAANKTARIVWAMMRREEAYRPRVA